jgi:hypothetical protein
MQWVRRRPFLSFAPIPPFLSFLCSFVVTFLFTYVTSKVKVSDYTGCIHLISYRNFLFYICKQLSVAVLLVCTYPSNSTCAFFSFPFLSATTNNKPPNFLGRLKNTRPLLAASSNCISNSNAMHLYSYHLI